MRLLVAFGMLLIALIGQGQHTISMRMHSDVLQSQELKPQNSIDSGKWVLSLPGATIFLGNTGFRYKDLVGSRGDSSYLKMDDMIAQLKENNYLTGLVSIPYGGISVRLNEGQFGLSFSENIALNARYTKSMFEFLYYGNSQFVGETVNLAPDLELLRYYELGLNTTRSIGKWKLGLTIKYLEGVSGISVQGNRLAVTTDADDYGITIESDIRVNSSNTKELTKIGSLPKRWFSNPGWGFDFGIDRKLNDVLSIGASLLDVGQIHWKRDVKTISNNNTFHFEGLDLSSFILGDSLSLKSYEDSIRDLLAFEESKGAFRSYTVPKALIYADYSLSEKVRVGGFMQFQFLDGGIQSNYGASIMRSIQNGDHRANLGAHYSYKSRNPFAIGLGGDYSYKFFQVFLMSDNMATWFLPKARVPISLFDPKSDVSIIIPKSLRSINFRFGFNLMFNTSSKK